jgi:hypothetical protein
MWLCAQKTKNRAWGPFLLGVEVGAGLEAVDWMGLEEAEHLAGQDQTVPPGSGRRLVGTQLRGLRAVGLLCCQGRQRTE